MPARQEAGFLKKLPGIFVVLLKKNVKGHCHGRSLRIRSINVESQSFLLYRAGSSWSESRDFNLALDKVRKVFLKRFYSGRAVKYKNIIVKVIRIVGKMAADCLVQGSNGKFDIILFEQIRDLGIVRVRKRDEEIVLPVFDYHINEILKFGFPMKDLPLPVNNVLLKIEGNIFGYAKIFHRIGNNDTQFIADPEKMINPGFAGKDHCREIKNIDLLMAKIL